MSNKKARAVSIKYTSREFDSIKEDLIDYIKRYYPDTYRDFNESSFGSLMVDTVAYIGDILSFYLDYQANETFLDTAVEYNNIIKLGKQLGYKFTTAPSSHGIATFYVLIPALTTGLGPDKRYMPVLKKGSTFKASTGADFILMEDVHFGNPNNEIRVARQNEATGVPTAFAVKGFGQVISGRYYVETHKIGDFTKFRKLSLNGLDISEVMSVIDLEGNEYYEVDYLSQNILYKGITNRDKTLSVGYTTGDQAAEILKPFMVPRRFVVSRDRRKTSVQFGASSDVSLPEDMIADPSNVVLKVHGKNYIESLSFDPTRLIESDKFGVAPSNTTLTVQYRLNNSSNVNCRVGQLNSVSKSRLEFDDITVLNTSTTKAVIGSLEVDNEEPITGDVQLPDATELKHRIYDTFATQKRAVTQQDYESVVYQMPTKFGAVKRCKILRDSDSLKRNLNLYVTSENRDGSLTRTNDAGKIESKKGVNFLGVSIDVPSLTPQDEIDLSLALENGADWIALSFTRSKEDYDLVRTKISNFGHDTPVMAKIEKWEAVKNLDSIVQAFDGVMVARGDLGVELPLEQVPVIQKNIIKKAKLYGKPVVIATQMLDSMIDNLVPTRAEVSDVANSILDGADTLMVTGETAMGNHPIDVINVLSDVIIETEKTVKYYSRAIGKDTVDSTAGAISHAACTIAKDLDIRSIVTMTQSGGTARMVSSFKPLANIYAMTTLKTTLRSLSIIWGVIPVLIGNYNSSDEIPEIAQKKLIDLGVIDKNEKCVITGGVPVNVPGTTNYISIL